MNDILYSLYKTERRLEQFYTLLVKESLDREDVSSLEQENVKYGKFPYQTNQPNELLNV